MYRNLQGLQSYTLLYRIVRSCTEFFRFVHSCTYSCSIVQSCAGLYRSLHCSVEMYIDVQKCSGLKRVLQNCTKFYRDVQPKLLYTELYKDDGEVFDYSALFDSIWSMILQSAMLQ